MPDTDRPAYLRLYFDAVSALPLPGERMTVAAYEKIRDLLWDDAKASEPKDGEADEKPAAHFTFPPGEHRLRLLGDPFDIVAADYRTGEGTATLHARRTW